jgi:hypothetical protein
MAFKIVLTLGMVVYSYNPSTLGAKARELQVQVHLALRREILSQKSSQTTANGDNYEYQTFECCSLL